MQVNRLTKTTVDDLKYNPDGPSQQIIWDPDLAGFGCRVYPSGKKSFVVSYRTRGRKRLHRIGRYGVWTLAKARKAAKSKLGVAAGDEDPAEHRDEVRGSWTVKKLCDEWVKQYAKPDKRRSKRPLGKKTWKADKSRLDRFVKPAIGSKLAQDVDTEDIEDIHETISQTAPYEANRTLAVVSVMYGWAMRKRSVPVPATMANPAKGVKRNKEVSRKEYVPEENLPDLGKAIDAEDNPYIRACFWLLLFTGMRRAEMLSCQWDHVELDNRRIFLPHTKSQEPQYVPLTPAAVELLKGLPRMLGNPYVLPGHIKGRALNNIDKPWRRIRDRAGLPRLRIHDLRRTAGSYMIQAGHSIDAVKNILRHKKRTTTEVYARLAEQQSRDTVDAYGKALETALKPKAADS